MAHRPLGYPSKRSSYHRRVSTAAAPRLVTTHAKTPHISGAPPLRGSVATAGKECPLEGPRGEDTGAEAQGWRAGDGSAPGQEEPEVDDALGEVVGAHHGMYTNPGALDHLVQ